MSKQSHPTGFLHRFLRFAASHPGTIAVHHLEDDVRVSYGALRTRAERINGALSALGLAHGERVMLLLPSSIHLVGAYLAALGRGAIPVMVNDKLTAHELHTVASDAAAPVIITSAAILRERRDLLAALPGVRAVLAVDAIEDAPELPCMVASLATLDASPVELKAPEGNPIATIQYTYKGLGQALPVAHRYLSLTQATDGLHAHWHRQGVGSVHLAALPLYAVFGLTVLLIFPLSVGATMTISGALAQHDIVDTLAARQVSFICMVPDLIRMLVRQLSRRKAPLPALHPQLIICSGGSYLDARLIAQLRDLLPGVTLLQGYGLTECLPVTVQHVARELKPGSIGQAIAGVELRVVDDRGIDVDPGCTGELLVRASTVAGAYLDRPHASERFFRDGWLHTGDLVWIDADGDVFFVGRLLRITKITAQMVDLAELESVAQTHPAVERALARVTRDAEGRNNLQLNVVCRRGADPGNAAILAHIKSRLSPFKLPRAIHTLEAA